jgi:hypothetical protein
MAKIYLMTSDKGVHICATDPITDDNWESNSIEVTDAHSCRFAEDHRLPNTTLETIIGNVLRAAGVELG